MLLYVCVCMEACVFIIKNRLFSICIFFPVACWLPLSWYVGSLPCPTLSSFWCCVICITYYAYLLLPTIFLGFLSLNWAHKHTHSHRRAYGMHNTHVASVFYRNPGICPPETGLFHVASWLISISTHVLLLVSFFFTGNDVSVSLISYPHTCLGVHPGWFPFEPSSCLACVCENHCDQ